jgi:RNA polymerase sigma-32 factor
MISNSYTKDVRRAIRLSRKEEEVAARNWVQYEDQGALDALVESNTRYVIKVALTYIYYGTPMEELIAVGNMGLLQAARKFDPDRDVKFITYADYWIRACIIRYILRNWSLVNTGSGFLRSKIFFKLRKEMHKLAGMTSDTVEIASSLASQFHEPVEKIELYMQRMKLGDASLNTCVATDSMVTAQDMLMSETLDPEETAIENQRLYHIQKRVRKVLHDLDPRERFIIERRIMVDKGDVQTLAILGSQLGISRERVRQLEFKAKQKLKKALNDFQSKELSLPI